MTTDVDIETFRQQFSKCRKEGESTRNWKKVWKEYKQNLSHFPNDPRKAHDACFRLQLQRIKTATTPKKRINWKVAMNMLTLLVLGSLAIYVFAKTVPEKQNNRSNYYYYNNSCKCENCRSEILNPLFVDDDRKKRKIGTYLRRLEILSSANREIELLFEMKKRIIE
jgi:hypothetical protein